MLALVGGEPRILNIHDMLYYYLQHQEEVVTRRTRYDLSKAQERAHILEGLLIALDHIDRVIEIIRGSANVAAAKASLIEEFWSFRCPVSGNCRYASSRIDWIGAKSSGK